jgi:alkylated DNA repair dioxygenase AlkB
MSGGWSIVSAPDGFLFVPDFLSSREQTDLLRELTEMNYEHDTFRGQLLKRGYAQFGYVYVSTGRRLEPVDPLPPSLVAVAGKALPQWPPGTTFNQCIVTHYPPGAGIGWHTDAPRFGECIVGVSLCGSGRLQFRQNGSKEVAFEVEASAGSMYLMRGPARWSFQHQVLPVRSERYSLTFRHVATQEE